VRSPKISSPRRLADTLGSDAGRPRERPRHGPDPQVVPQQDQPQAGRVCGGLAQYFNVDATLIRVLLVLLAVLGGSGLVLYVAMWIIVPKEP
jgi:phage shock protein PspC (stress-responsive transcriptional regulator)